MVSFVLVIALAAFLAGAATAVFFVLVIGIRKADRPRGGPAPRNSPLDTATRSMLRASTWPNNPVVHGDCEQRRPERGPGQR